MRLSRTLMGLGLIPVLVAVAACGKSGGGSGPAAVDANAPVITNLRASFGPPCTLQSTNLPGTVETLAFEYADADGNVRGGTVEATATAAAGGPITLTPTIPSSGVAITGTTSGTITVTACLHFGGNASVTEQVKVIDASGKASNELTIEVPRPGGAPLLPRSDQSGFGKTLEPAR